MLIEQTGSGMYGMATPILQMYSFQLQNKVSTKFQRLHLFSGSHYPMAIERILHDPTETVNSKMAAATIGNTTISARWHDSKTVPTTGHMFSATDKSTKLVQITYLLTGSKKSNVAASKTEIHISQLVEAGKFLVLYIYGSVVVQYSDYIVPLDRWTPKCRRWITVICELRPQI